MGDCPRPQRADSRANRRRPGAGLSKLPIRRVRNPRLKAKVPNNACVGGGRFLLVTVSPAGVPPLALGAYRGRVGLDEQEIAACLSLGAYAVAHEVVGEFVARLGHGDVVPRTTDRLSAKLIQPCFAGLANGMGCLCISRPDSGAADE